MKHINAKYFSTFVAAANSPSFTEASEKCCMSQANVSKQIATLEQQVGHKLFDRRKNKPTITNAGKILIEYINGLEHLHVDYVLRLTSRIEELDGLVSYAMPASCLLSPHFPMLMEKRRNYPNLDINLTIESNENVFQMLTKGTVDFGFLTKRISHQRLTSKVFCQEEYVLVGSTAEAVNKISSGKASFNKGIFHIQA